MSCSLHSFFCLFIMWRFGHVLGRSYMYGVNPLGLAWCPFEAIRKTSNEAKTTTTRLKIWRKIYIFVYARTHGRTIHSESKFVLCVNCKLFSYFACHITEKWLIYCLILLLLLLLLLFLISAIALTHSRAGSFSFFFCCCYFRCCRSRCLMRTKLNFFLLFRMSFMFYHIMSQAEKAKWRFPLL